jgi:hypothetical protein
MLMPDAPTTRVNGWRQSLKTLLWVTAHSWLLIASAVSAALLAVGIRRWVKQRKNRQIP